MQKIKIIKKRFKDLQKYRIYKKRFKKSMAFIFSYIALIHQETIDLDFLFEEEMRILNTHAHPEMFVKSFTNLAQKLQDQINWKAFGLFLWYIFQIITYKHDYKKGIKNIYNPQNYVEINNKKRIKFNQWLESIPYSQSDYNGKIIKVMKKVF